MMPLKFSGLSHRTNRPDEDAEEIIRFQDAEGPAIVGMIYFSTLMYFWIEGHQRALRYISSSKGLPVFNL